jgi:hypothetical protein
MSSGGREHFQPRGRVTMSLRDNDLSAPDPLLTQRPDLERGSPLDLERGSSDLARGSSDLLGGTRMHDSPLLYHARPEGTQAHLFPLQMHRTHEHDQERINAIASIIIALLSQHTILAHAEHVAGIRIECELRNQIHYMTEQNRHVFELTTIPSQPEKHIHAHACTYTQIHDPQHAHACT